MAISPDKKPAPPRVTKISGCVQALGLTCGTLTLLVVVLAMIGGKILQSQGPHPNVKTTAGAEAAWLTSLQDGQKIAEAITYYHASQGVYPDSLDQLVPQSLPDRAILHSALDTSPDPNHISWTYVKPAPNAPSTTTVLKLSFVVPIDGSSPKINAAYEVDFDLEGTPTNKPVGTNKSLLPLFGAS